MKVLLDIKDSKAIAFMEMIKDYSYVKAKTLSAPDTKLLEEIREINRALNNAKDIKNGKLKARPIARLLDEL